MSTLAFPLDGVRFEPDGVLVRRALDLLQSPTPTAETVMRDEVMTQRQAWAAYDRWLRDPRVELVDEPADVETRFRALTRLRQPATKDWADSYLAAFATVGQLTLVTFDRGLRSKAKSAILLGE